MSQTVEQITDDFLKSLEEHDIFQFNDERFTKKSLKIKEFLKRYKIISGSYVKISQSTEKQEILTSDERMVFLYWNTMNIVNSTLELSKVFLSLLLDDSKISFNDKTTYGTLIIKICNEIKYEQSYKDMLFDKLYVNFRNSLAHEDYDITKEGVFLYDGDKKIHLDYDGINNAMEEVKCILLSIQNFVNRKAAEFNKMAAENEQKEQDLKAQIKDIDEQISKLKKS
ncbi:MAG: hypothetical protein K5790_02275 [Nitrosopumilus sp.]|uniref:hypothetical protein n=1 Tax=Nitrosopumilus sp. TaxID=2024843 RepID=UPI00247C8C48|nr:hypothetical protein [Nitrosopumilus sp.]MCV0392101.1 hypothetical protein [Nitrosopumilus sp.]